MRQAAAGGGGEGGGRGHRGERPAGGGEKGGGVPKLGAAETRAAIEAARVAQRDWAANREERCQILRRWYELMIDNKDDLGRDPDDGAGQAAGRATGEIVYGASFIEWFAEEGGASTATRSPRPARQAHPGDQAADRRRRGDHAVELPEHDDHAQGRAGARRRLHHGREARRSRRRFGARAGRARRARRLPAGVFNVSPAGPGDRRAR